ncbi:MAG TPA: Fic family protein [Catalimonadaceae bacterium]|mgnify:CR=1 FL=1|nr:Fic family protein [Catalimonadaceae bacterium]
MELSGGFPSDGIPDFIVLAGMKGAFPRIDELSRQLKQLGSLSDANQKRLDKKFRMEFNYNSNHIEGNTLTYNETKLLLIFDDTQGNHTLREYEEMKAHDVALKLVKEWAEESKDRPLTEQNIKNLNEIIQVRPFWKDALTPDGQKTRREIKVGDYKAFPNSVILANGEVFEYASPQDTPIMMGELMAWYRNELEKQELEPVALAAIFHYKFVHIHPFDDGNGRLARLLMNYVLFCYSLPPVIIKHTDKEDYLRALNRADTGDLKAFVAYIANQLEWGLELAIKAAKGESIEEEDDLDKEIALLGKEANRFRTSEIEKSETVVQQIVFTELVSFLDKLDDILLSIASLFRKVQIEFTPIFSGSGKRHEIFSFEEATSKVEEDSRSASISNLGQLNFNIYFDGLMTSPSIPSVRIEVGIDFKMFGIEFYVLNSDVRTMIHYNDSGRAQKIMECSNLIKKEIQKRVLALAKSDSPTDQATA